MASGSFLIVKQHCKGRAALEVCLRFQPWGFLPGTLFIIGGRWIPFATDSSQIARRLLPPFFALESRFCHLAARFFLSRP
jgi:hypothetical protein